MADTKLTALAAATGLLTTELVYAVQDLGGTPASKKATIAQLLALGVASIIGTANQVIASTPTGDVTLSLPQSIATTSTPTFAGLGATPIITSYAGPHAIGGATNTTRQFDVTGSFTGSSSAYGVYLSQTLIPAVGGDAAGALWQPTLNKAGSGTHTDFATFILYPPTIGAGAATLSNASTLKIIDAPTAGSNNYGLWVVAGGVRLGGLGAFAASDKYVIADANGNLHVSALGPAS